MHPQDIAARVTGLPVPSAAGYFPLDYVAGNIYLSRSSTGDPCLVLTYASRMRLPSGRRTEGLQLMFHEEFAVTIGGQTSTRRCGVLQCVSSSLQYYFYLMVSGLISKVSAEPHWLEAPSSLLEYVEEWQSLLQNRRAYTPEEEIGLWGELHLILSCPDCDGAVASWKGPLRKTHDFAANSVDLDVKASLQGHSHHFRLEQLQPSPSCGSRFICSVRVVEDHSGGRTIDDLVELIRQRLDDPGPFEKLLLEAHFTEGAARTMRLSELETLFVSANDVPSVIPAPGVSRVEFVSDLRLCTLLTDDESTALLQKLTLHGGA